MRVIGQDEFFGEQFWKNAKKARKRDARAQTIREFMKMNRECQKGAYTASPLAHWPHCISPRLTADHAAAVGSAKYGSGPPAPKASKKPKGKIWEASTLDERKMRVEDFDPGKREEKTRADKLEARYAKEDKTGYRRFDLDANERTRDYKAEPVVRQDRKRYDEKDIIKGGTKSKQFRDANAKKGDAYGGPRGGGGFQQAGRKKNRR